MLREAEQIRKAAEEQARQMVEKEEIVENVFRDNVSREMTGFLKLVVSKERYGEIRNIFHYFIDKMKEEKKIGVAYVTCAVALDDARKKAVEDKLLETTDYKKMEMHYDVDEGLIGGMVIRIGDRIVDSSVRTKIEEMKKTLWQIQLG